jgi:hypothetical protein
MCGLICWAIALAAMPGCVVETKSGSPFVPVTGQVTYLGAAVKNGVIHLLPIDPKGTAASGEILGGAIKNVTSHTFGDGAKPGKYRVSIIVFDDTAQEEKGQGGPAVPTATSYVELLSRVKKTIPLRYSDVRRSGLTAEISTGFNDLHYDLNDDQVR